MPLYPHFLFLWIFNPCLSYIQVCAHCASFLVLCSKGFHEPAQGLFVCLFLSLCHWTLRRSWNQNTYLKRLPYWADIAFPLLLPGLTLTVCQEDMPQLCLRTAKVTWQFPLVLRGSLNLWRFTMRYAVLHHPAAPGDTLLQWTHGCSGYIPAVDPFCCGYISVADTLL